MLNSDFSHQIKMVLSPDGEHNDKNEHKHLLSILEF